MWEAIAYVSSGITLAAFIVAVSAWLLKVKSDEKEKLINAATDDRKARLVQDTLEFFHVDTLDLTKEQKYKIALQQIKARSSRFRLITFLILFLSLIAAFLSAYAISIKSEVDEKESRVYESEYKPFIDDESEVNLEGVRVSVNYTEDIGFIIEPITDGLFKKGLASLDHRSTLANYYCFLMVSAAPTSFSRLIPIPQCKQ